MNQIKIPKDLLQARRLTRMNFEIIANKYMHMSFYDIEEIMKKKKKEIPAVDFMILSVIYHAIKDGDQKRLDFLLDRTIGSAVRRIFVEAEEDPQAKGLPVEMTAVEKIQMAERYAQKMKEIENKRTIDVVNKNTDPGTDKPPLQEDDE